VLDGHATWQALRAVREGRVYLADGNAFFNRPGPRLVESAEIIAEIFHGDAFDRGHAAAGHWIRWQSAGSVLR
jgi:iron complex transport system substrate-binding protein